MPHATEPPWYEDAVIYQVYLRSFFDSDGDGIGDLEGLVAELDHVVRLGVDAIWLSPFYRSPMVDFGYDVADHCDVDPAFGDLAAFDRMLAAAHARGLRVLVDYVVNHTSDRHPWFVESRTGRDSPRRDWYVWRDPAPGGGPPNNWLGAFGGSAWSLDEATGQYYLHSFDPAQPDLAWDNLAVREAMWGVARFWLDRGVDGFRVDAADYPIKDAKLRDNPPAEEHRPHRRGPRRPLDAFVQRYNKDRPQVHDLYRELRRVVDAYGDRVTVGEVRLTDRPRWAAYFGEHGDGLHLVHDFSLVKSPWSATALAEAIEATLAALPAGAWPGLVLGNHDEPRIATRCGDAGARIAAMLLLTLRGTPTIYNGDELGLHDVPIPAALMKDPPGRVDPRLSRDPCRTPIPWTPEGGFTRPGVPPWLPLGDNVQRSVAAQIDDPASMLSLYRRVLALRKQSRALRRGEYVARLAPEGCLVYERILPDERVMVALSFIDRPQRIDLELPADARVVLSTSNLERDIDGRLVLQPHEGAIVSGG